jgi:hypothetical protein
LRPPPLAKAIIAVASEAALFEAPSLVAVIAVATGSKAGNHRHLPVRGTATSGSRLMTESGWCRPAGSDHPLRRTR